MQPIIITKILKNKLINLYKTGYSTCELSKKFNIGKTVILNFLHKHHVRMRKTGYRTHFMKDENFFNKINTPEKAYFLGILFADGTNSLKRHSVRIRLRDYELVKKLNDLIFNENKISKEFGKSEWYVGEKRISYGLSIHSKKVSDTLNEYGCVPNKTLILKFPKHLSKNLIRHFIRGYFDGDGSISISFRSGKYASACLTFESSEKFCLSLKRILKQRNIHSYLSFRHKTHTSASLKISGNRQILSLLNWFYDKSTIHLNRKYEKYLQLKELCKNIDIKKKTIRRCLVCNRKHFSYGYCYIHWYPYTRKLTRSS